MKMARLVADYIGVTEIYRSPRVAKRAEQWGLKCCWGLDLTTRGHDGKPWGFSSLITKRITDAINNGKPLLIVGSPMCKDWSTFMKLDWGKMPSEDKERQMTEVHKQLRFRTNVYKHQISEGRYHLQEHPINVKSWHEIDIKELPKRSTTY